jgi:hypothetical protein
MSRRLLTEAAKDAGITEVQAEAFVRAILHPTTLMCEAGSRRVGLATMMFSDLCPTELTGQSPGEADLTEAAAVWRRMASGLLAGAEFQPAWAHELWPHPASDYSADWNARARLLGREELED